MACTVRVALLGPLAVSVGGAPVSLPRYQQRRLLTRLAIDSPSPVSIDALIELLWPHALPVAPPAALRVALSRLRSALGPGAAAISRNGGYRLDAEVDVAQFEGLLATASSTEDELRRAALLESAIGLWRGEPFADALDAESLMSARVRLEQARLEASMALAQALTAAGRSDRVVALLGASIHHHLDHEQLVRVVAAALAVHGRPTAALHLLDACQAHRGAHGLGPSLRLVELADAVRADAVAAVTTPD